MGDVSGIKNIFARLRIIFWRCLQYEYNYV